MHLYKLTGADNQTYLSEKKGLFGGHNKLKIYGRLDCPSALRHIKNGNYIQHRVFFEDEATALAAGYRPCGICMKEHYNLWKRGTLMMKALKATPILKDGIICSVQLANGEEKYFRAETLNNCQIETKLQGGIEYCHIEIEDDDCIIIMSDENSQWGYTIVWNYAQDKLIHLTNTPYVTASAIMDSNVINMYLVQYWGHPADLWYSVAPLQMIDSEYEPDMKPLHMPVDDSVSDISSCKITIQNNSVLFQAGKQEKSIKI
ncbi:MAG: hypothetical protein LUI14_13515 [Lachnospiraceae bacterium]|nr:hypothetical protein [Lachnospiraceae bacterium]